MLRIPVEIDDLIRAGIWPVSGEDAQRQNLRSIVSRDAVKRFAPEEEAVFFYPPPFAAVTQLVGSAEKSFWADPRSRIDQLAPDRTLVIGDFGLGSDAPLVLDYRASDDSPRVIRLKWSAKGNEWVEVASSFERFVEIAELRKAAQPGATDNPDDEQRLREDH